MGLGLQCINAGADGRGRGRARRDRRGRSTTRLGRTRLFGALDTLEHLRRGGRIGAAQALLGGMLSIKPVIEVRDGAVAEAGKVRTRSKSLKLLADKVAAATNPQQVFVFDAQAPDIDEMVELLAPTVSRDQIEFGTIGPVIGTARRAAHHRRRLGRRSVAARARRNNGARAPRARTDARVA